LSAAGLGYIQDARADWQRRRASRGGYPDVWNRARELAALALSFMGLLGVGPVRATLAEVRAATSLRATLFGRVATRPRGLVLFVREPGVTRRVSVVNIVCAGYVWGLGERLVGLLPCSR
jgi:hypothetical protein